MSCAVIDGVTLHVGPPLPIEQRWVGQDDLVRQLLAAWLVVDKQDQPMCPRLVGKPGVGKTALACEGARRREQPVYLFQATMDTRPEDLIVSPVIAQDRSIKYAASAVVSAMINGGLVVLDEGNRMSEKSWAGLAPLLDHRRYVESVVAGIRIPAHPEFRFCTTMNEDASTYDLPEYIHSRLMPQIDVGFPDAAEERAILMANLPFAREDVLDRVVSYLQTAHGEGADYTIRDGINIARYAIKSAAQDGSAAGRHLKQSVIRVLGEDALEYFGD